MRLPSPKSRVAETLVAGNALGTTVRRIRRRGFVIVKEDMDTTQLVWSAHLSTYTHATYTHSGFGLADTAPQAHLVYW